MSDLSPATSAERGVPVDDPVGHGARRTPDGDDGTARELVATPEDVGSLQQPRRRHSSDLLRVVLGLVVLAVASLPVRPDAIGRVETGAFDLFNGLPDVLYPVLWGPMQLGALAAVPVVAVAALLLRRRRLAIDAAVTGGLAWVLAKVVKDAFGRPRPGGLVEEISHRGHESIGMGFVSGHTAVAFALATAAVLHLPRRWRGPTFGLALLVGLARIYVGAHLPLDVVGGAALGWAIGSAYRWIVGAPTGRPPNEVLAKGVAGLGLRVERVVALPSVRAHSSAPYLLLTEDGEQLFAKVVSDRPQDRDALHRWWLRLARRSSTEQRYRSPLLQVTHEATMLLAARAAGVRVPDVRLAERFDGGAGLLVTTWVPGTPLGDFADDGGPPAAVTEDALRQLALLHAAGHTHGHPAAENLLVAGDRVTFVDFGEGRLGASDDERRADLERLRQAVGG